MFLLFLIEIKIYYFVQGVAKINRTRFLLAQASDKPVTSKEIARALGMSQEKVDMYVTVSSDPRSLEDPIKASSLRADHEGDQTLADVLEDGQPTPDDIIMQVSHRKHLIPLLRMFSTPQVTLNHIASILFPPSASLRQLAYAPRLSESQGKHTVLQSFVPNSAYFFRHSEPIKLLHFLVSTSLPGIQQVSFSIINLSSYAQAWCYLVRISHDRWSVVISY